MAQRSIQARQLDVRPVRLARPSERRPYRAMVEATRLALSDVERSNTLRSVSPKDANVRLARLLDASPLCRLSQEVLDFGRSA